MLRLLAAQPKLVTPALPVVHLAITRSPRGQAGLSAGQAPRALRGCLTLKNPFFASLRQPGAHGETVAPGLVPPAGAPIARSTRSVPPSLLSSWSKVARFSGGACRRTAAGLNTTPRPSL